jgi:hypothetical protein
MRRWPVIWWALGGCPWISADELAERNDLDGDGVVGLFDCDDGDRDAGLPGLWVEDADGDGHGAGVSVSACAAPEGYVALADDCDDGDGTVFPGASERCDGIDDDCDGAVDDDDDIAAADLLAFYPDADDDGWPDVAGNSVLACVAPADHVAFDGAWDCDDDDPSVRPDAAELCADAVDNDCDGAVDEEGVVEEVVSDVDGDGFAGSEDVFRYCAPPPGFVPRDAVDGRLDCNDADAAVNPDAPTEVCANGRDDDCDGAIDDVGAAGDPAAVPSLEDRDRDGSAADPGATPLLVCAGRAGFVPAAVAAGLGADCDDDDPGFGPAAVDLPYDGLDQDCVGGDLVDVDEDGYALGLDCLDTDAAVHPGPGSIEACGNGLDDDCDGRVDDEAPGRPVWLPDGDGDGYRGGTTERRWCSDGVAGWVLQADDRGPDCADDEPGVHPGAVEVPYDGIDQDCGGGDLVDVDGDGFDVIADCDDTDERANPGPLQVELCDGVDNDCDGGVDLGAVDAEAWYADGDGDGYPPDAALSASCDVPDGAVRVPDVLGFGDCDDADATAHPGATEQWYDGVDGDCLGGDDFDQDADGSPLSEDCDDLDPAKRPDPAGELICNDGVDDDCDGIPDFRARSGVAHVPDEDLDGFPNPTAPRLELCRTAVGYVPADAGRPADCDDTDANVFPGAPDPVDGADRDCDGLDSDRDGDGDPDPDDCAGDDPTVFHGATERCDAIDQDCDGTSGEELPLATAMVNGVEVDVTDSYATLALDGVERLRLCGTSDRVVAWTAGANDTFVEVLGGTVTGSPLLVDAVGTGDVTFERVVFAPAGAGPLIAFEHGGRLVLRKVEVAGALGPVVALAGGSSLRIESGTWSDGRGDGVTCVGCGTVELSELGVSNLAGRLVVAEGAGGVRPRVVLTDVEVGTGGGLLEAVDADAELARVTVADTSAVDGGAVSLVAASLRVVDSSFFDNRATERGGAVAGDGSDVELEHVVFDGNAARIGGAVGLIGGSLREVATIHTFNTATDDGGAVWAVSGTVVSERARYLANEASKGGAVWLGPDGLGTWSAVDAQDNVATAFGGAFVVDRAILLLSAGSFEWNAAPSAGAIWFRGFDLDTAVFGAQVAFNGNAVDDVNTQSFNQKVKTLVCLGPAGVCQ